MLKKLWLGWQRLGRWIGDQVARIFLVVFYFTVMLPFGLLVRLAQDPLDMRSKAGAGWIARENQATTLDEAERLY